MCWIPYENRGGLKTRPCVCLLPIVLPDFQHPVHGAFGPNANLFGDIDDLFVVL
jgi:hypothetical protein